MAGLATINLVVAIKCRRTIYIHGYPREQPPRDRQPIGGEEGGGGGENTFGK